MVARQNQDIFGVELLDKGDVLVNGVCRTLVPLSFFRLDIGRQHIHAAEAAVEVPRYTVADVCIQLERLILRENADRFNAGMGAVAECEVDNAVLPAERDGRLGDVLCQCAEPAALSAR